MYREYYFTVRGYELDSFDHVNHAVYINYAEEARWKIINEENLFDFLRLQKLHPVVIEVRIKYIQELKIFDKVVIRSHLSTDGDYFIAKQDFYLVETNTKVAKAFVKSIFVHKDSRLACSLPRIMKDKLDADVHEISGKGDFNGMEY